MTTALVLYRTISLNVSFFYVFIGHLYNIVVVCGGDSCRYFLSVLFVTDAGLAFYFVFFIHGGRVESVGMFCRVDKWVDFVKNFAKDDEV